VPSEKRATNRRVWFDGDTNTPRHMIVASWSGYRATIRQCTYVMWPLTMGL